MFDIADISDDNPVYVIQSFLPPVDASIEYLNKYIQDLAYHYERGFYNLALFSYHYLYMAILHMYILKYHRMDVKIANSCRQGRPPRTVLNPTFYSDIKDEKSRIRLLRKHLDKETIKKHMELVSQRDRVAHFTGDLLLKDQIDRYVATSEYILTEIQKVAFVECLKIPTDNFSCQIKEICSESDKDTRFNKISDLIQDFYLSEKDINYLMSEYHYNFFAEYIKENGYSIL